ncbi:jg14549 [Pararge aegeria aegeria]|uniref:Jg14549 protein n=1 Tax=Pararge aegeria aegeria TaxID=348720 RepID=A0A8S4RFM3_9NEOP|nr:jg14549 [Pararge aegeria aegeria]
MCTCLPRDPRPVPLRHPFAYTHIRIKYPGTGDGKIGTNFSEVSTQPCLLAVNNKTKRSFSPDYLLQTNMAGTKLGEPMDVGVPRCWSIPNKVDRSHQKSRGEPLGTSGPESWSLERPTEDLSSS